MTTFDPTVYKETTREQWQAFSRASFSHRRDIGVSSSNPSNWIQISLIVNPACCTNWINASRSWMVGSEPPCFRALDERAKAGRLPRSSGSPRPLFSRG